MKHTLKRLWLGLVLLVVGTGAAATQTTTYFHNDAAGSPVLATDAAGEMLWKESYLPYGGKVNNQPASQENSIGFHGKSYDAHTGLSYMTARYYDPVLGRFTGVDPQGFDPESPSSFNRYAYANNNPAKFVDPDGRIPVLILIPVALKAVDLTLTAIDLYMAAQTGGSSGLAKAVVQNAVTSASPIPGSKIAVKIADRVGDAATAAKKVTSSELRAAGRADFKASRAEALAANGGKCTYCDNAATAGDHVKSLKSWADDVNAGKISKSDAVKQANARDNITGACTACNTSKGARELSQTEGPGKWVAPNGFYRE